MNLDTEHYDGANTRNSVGNHKRHIAANRTLDHEKYGARPHKQECGEGYSVSFTGAYGMYGLRQIAEHHANCSSVAKYG